MHGLAPPPLDVLRCDIAAALPDFAASDLEILNAGWDSVGVAVDGTWILKFPRHDEAVSRLRRECAVLRLIRPAVPVAVPDMRLIESGPRLFSIHGMLPGGTLQTADYLGLSNLQRDAIAEQMAGLYAALHAMPGEAFAAAGARPVEPWFTSRDVMAAEPNLPEPLRLELRQTITEFDALPRDDQIYGYFDGHGWNMAFDAATGVLNGVYDFADSGFGPRHKDLSYSDWISRDLTRRIVDRYERLTGIAIDRRKVHLFSRMLRFVELAQAGIDANAMAACRANLDLWFDPASDLDK